MMIVLLCSFIPHNLPSLLWHCGGTGTGTVSMILHAPSKNSLRSILGWKLVHVQSGFMLPAQVWGFDSASLSNTAVPGSMSALWTLKVQIRTLFPPDNDSLGMSLIRMYWNVNQTLKRSSDVKVVNGQCWVLCCTKVYVDDDTSLYPSSSLSNLQLIGKSSSKLPKQLLLKC